MDTSATELQTEEGKSRRVCIIASMNRVVTVLFKTTIQVATTPIPIGGLAQLRFCGITELYRW